MPDEVADEQLAKGLRQVRQKPHNFAILAKGPNVLKVILRKKPIKASDIQDAKSECKASLVVTGVCEGEGGTGIVFRVVGEEPSIRANALRDHLNEQAGLTIKPRFEVVTQLNEVNDDGDDSKAIPSQTPSRQAPEQAKEEAAELTRKLNQLAPKIQDAVKAHPKRKDELLRPLGAFKRQIAELDIDGAKQSLVTAAKLLAQFSAEGDGEVAQQGQGLQPRVEAAKQLAQEWREARETAASGVGKLLGALAKIKHPVAGEVAEVVSSLQQQFPTLIDEALSQMGGAQDANRFAEACRLTKAGAANAVRYLQGNADDISLCEQNPFGVRVAIAGPLTMALKKVVGTVQKIEKM